MIKREELNGLTHEELGQKLELDIQAYRAEVETIETEDEILAREQDLMKLQDEYQEYMSKVIYQMPDGCTYDGTAYTKSKVQEMIVDFINTQEVEWAYTLGLFELNKLWRTRDLVNVPYAAYDSTLRVLNQCKFKGYDAWRKILTVNEFMSASHLQYAADTSYTIYLGQLHSVLVDQLKTFHPEVEQVNEDVPVR